MTKPGKNSGFTILELLVVVAIIGILTALAMALLSDTRARSRDARRLSDVGEIEKALNLYYAGIGNFPISVSTTTITGDDAVSTALKNQNTISETPRDPLHDSYTYRYQSNDLGTTFTLYFCLETDTIQGFESDCSNFIKP